MKKNLVFIICFLFSGPAFCQRNNVVTIKGTLTGDLKGFNKIYIYTRTTNDSANITDGHYTFTFPFEKPQLKFLYPEYIKGQGMMYSPYGILISEPGTYYVSSIIEEGMHASKLKGPESLVLYNDFQKDYSNTYKNINLNLQKIYGDTWWKQDEKSPLYQKIQYSTDSLKRALILPMLHNLVSQHPGSFASAYILDGIGKDIGTVGDKEGLYHSLTEKIKQSVAAKDYFDYIQGLRNSRVGETIGDFKLPDPAGKAIDFRAMKGKYVLIDFWASWCWPCRNSFPHMREIYKKYKGKNFEMYSISIDESKSDWLKAVGEEKNPWPQTLDTKNIATSIFAVTAVPSTFLISPDGKIIEKEVGFDPEGNGKIEKRIQKLFAEGNSKMKKINSK